MACVDGGTRLPQQYRGARHTTPEWSLRIPHFVATATVSTLGIAVLASSIVLLRADSRDAGPPAFVVKPYLQLPAQTGMTVMWETNVKLPSRIEFGTTPDLGGAAESRAAVTLHEIRLLGLEPATSYFYRVRSGPLVSEVRRLRTAPPLGTRKWRLALYGDSRSNPAAHRKVVEQIAKANVDLILHTGDIVLDGRYHELWQREFFAPLAPIAGTIPWVSTIGNHERDAANYFSYTALPGNKHYFSFDYANAHFICLDSNAWIAKGRDSEQFQWLQRELRRKRETTWTFVAFHHPLFSAHANRAINPLRWDWAPLLLDPENHVDGVLTGHDHFYGRDYRIGYSSLKPETGVFFLTSAGGGAPLYPLKKRDYVASGRVVHHFTLFEFDGDQVALTAVDRDGNVFDRYVLTKEPTPPEQFCAFEIEQIRQFLRTGVSSMAPIPLSTTEQTRIDQHLSIPTRFSYPISGKLRWNSVPGWHLKRSEVSFTLQPKQPLDILLQADVDAGSFRETPGLTIEFENGHFRNRSINLHPFKLGGPASLAVSPARQAPATDGKSDGGPWKDSAAVALLAAPPDIGRADIVRLLADGDWLYVRAELDDPAGKVSVAPPTDQAPHGGDALLDEQFRVLFHTGSGAWSFAISPEQSRAVTHDGIAVTSLNWRATASRTRGGWGAELAIPRKLLVGDLGINLVHHLQHPPGRTEPIDFELCPTYRLGPDPDHIPDWKADGTTEGFARILLP